MPDWNQLAEARIRDWLQLPADLRDATPVALEPDLPLEVQLQQDIAQLDRMADASADAVERAALRKKANELMLRLSVVLEHQGRPLAAQHFAEQRRAGR